MLKSYGGYRIVEDINFVVAISLVIVGGAVAFGGWLAFNAKPRDRFYEKNPKFKRLGPLFLLYSYTGLLHFFILLEAWRMRATLRSEWRIFLWGLISFLTGVGVLLLKPFS